MARNDVQPINQPQRPTRPVRPLKRKGENFSDVAFEERASKPEIKDMAKNAARFGLEDEVDEEKASALETELESVRQRLAMPMFDFYSTVAEYSRFLVMGGISQQKVKAIDQKRKA